MAEVTPILTQELIEQENIYSILGIIDEKKPQRHTSNTSTLVEI